MTNLIARPKLDVPAAISPTPSVNIEREKSQFLSLTEKEAFYVVGGKRTPSARIVREWAKQESINYEVLEYGKDKEKAWAKVRGWKGTREAPEIVAEEPIVHVFSHWLIESVFDAIANGIKLPSGFRRLDQDDWTLGEEGWPIILDREVQFQLLRNHLGRIKIAERDAVTKAFRRVVLNIIGEGEKEEGGAEEEQENIAYRDPLDQNPRTLEEAREIIRTVISEICGGDMEAAAKKLEDISDVPDKYLAVNRLLKITALEHAQEIIARLRQEKINAEKNQALL